MEISPTHAALKSTLHRRYSENSHRRGRAFWINRSIELARRGIAAKIIAVGIFPKSLELPSESDATESLITTGIRFEELGIYFDSNRVLTLSTTSGHPKREYLIGLAQDRTEAVLEETLERD